MSRRSQTELAVLGALSFGPMTGYEVRAGITEVLGHFWSESFGQIYPALAALEARGCVRRAAPGRTSGTRFEITDDGLVALREGLADDFPSPPRRNALLLRLFLGSHLAPGRREALVHRARADAEQAAATYAGIRAETLAEPPTLDRALRLATVSYGEHLARAQREWADETLAALRAAGGDDDRG